MLLYSHLIVLLLLLVVKPLLILSQDSSSLLVPDSEDNDDDNQKGMFNFASHAAGAVILDKSPANAKGFSNLLNDDKDKYAIATCSEKKWVVIGLSEDILVKTVVLANYEKYSSQLKNFQLLASTSFPTDQWINLGTYQAEPKLGEQVFEVTNSSSHTRYLKFKFMTHYDDEALCTLSQIKVHGTTVIASFQEEVKISEATMRDMLSQLNLDENIQKTDEKNDSDSTITSIQIDATESRQFIQVEANNDSVVEIVYDNSSSEANLINNNIDDNVDLKIINEEEITIIGENVTVVGSKDVENDSEYKESVVESSQVINSQITPPMIESLSQDKINSDVEAVISERIDDVSTISNNDSKEGDIDSIIEKPSLDDKIITELIELEDNTTVDDTIPEDKGTSLMQAIAESTVHAVKEIVLAPLRQIPKPKIQHGKMQTVTGPLNEVEENLFGIASKNENIVTPDKLVTDIKDLDKHHVHRSNSIDSSITISNDSINDTSLNVNENNKTIEVIDTDETIDAIKSDNGEVMEVIPSVGQDTIAKSTSVALTTNNIDEEVTNDIEAKEDLISSLQSNAAIDLLIKNYTDIETDGNNDDIKQEEVVDNTQALNVIYNDEIENTTISTSVTNILAVENDTIISPDIDKQVVNTNVTLSGLTNTDNNSTSIAIDAIDQADLIVERPKNDSLLTNNMKKSPILQPTSSSRVVPPLSANCLETLKFADFQAKMVAKLVNTSDDKDRSVPLTSQDNVFRHLMQKIKMLEMNYAIIEMYSIQIGDCYRAVLGDLAVNVSISLQASTTAASTAAVSAEVLTNISYNRPIKYDNLKLTGGNGIINKGRDKVIIDGLENLLRYNEDDVIQLIAVALILGLLSLFVSAAIGLYVLFKLRNQNKK